VGYKEDIAKLRNELHDLIFFDPADLFTMDGRLQDVRQIPDKARKLIKSFKVRQTMDGAYIYDVQLHDKLSAIVNLAKHLGFYEEDNLQSTQGGGIYQVIFAAVEDIKSGKINEIIKLKGVQDETSDANSNRDNHSGGNIDVTGDTGLNASNSSSNSDDAGSAANQKSSTLYHRVDSSNLDTGGRDVVRDGMGVRSGDIHRSLSDDDLDDEVFQ